jgi:hypothetical protein
MCLAGFLLHTSLHVLAADSIAERSLRRETGPESTKLQSIIRVSGSGVRGTL